LFGPLKEHLGGQKFETDNELKHGVLDWLLRLYPILLASVLYHGDGKDV
jgi:hypothetical protein